MIARQRARVDDSAAYNLRTAGIALIYKLIGITVHRAILIRSRIICDEAIGVRLAPIYTRHKPPNLASHSLILSLFHSSYLSSTVRFGVSRDYWLRLLSLLVAAGVVIQAHRADYLLRLQTT